MCCLLRSRLCWTYLGAAGEVVSSSWLSLEKHTFRWLRVPLDTKPSNSSLEQGKGTACRVTSSSGNILSESNFSPEISCYSCDHGLFAQVFPKSRNRAVGILLMTSMSWRLSFESEYETKFVRIMKVPCMILLRVTGIFLVLGHVLCRQQADVQTFL